ncbi:hypothetical protein Tco_0168479 [Tanacetum coccineum]
MSFCVHPAVKKPTFCFYTDSEPGQRVCWGAVDEEYIPLEDEHELPAEEQPLPHVDSQTVESPGMRMTRNEEEEEVDHLSSPQPTCCCCTIMSWLFSTGNIALLYPPPYHLTFTKQAYMHDNYPYFSIFSPLNSVLRVIKDAYFSEHQPPISLSPPSAGERLARCTALPVHSSPLPMPSPLLPSSGCPTQIQTLRIASTQALINAVTAALPSPPLPPSLYIPPPIDCKDDIPESEQPPRKRLCLSTLGSKYEVSESSTTRPTRSRGIDYGFFRTVDAEERVTELAELHEQDTQDLYALLEDAQDSRSRISQRVDMDSQRVTHQELQTHRNHMYASETHLQAYQTQLQLQGTLIQTQHQVHETRFQMQQAELATLRETDRRRQAQMVETLRVIRDMRREMSDMPAE